MPSRTRYHPELGLYEQYSEYQKEHCKEAPFRIEILSTDVVTVEYGAFEEYIIHFKIYTNKGETFERLYRHIFEINPTSPFKQYTIDKHRLVVQHLEKHVAEWLHSIEHPPKMEIYW